MVGATEAGDLKERARRARLDVIGKELRERIRPVCSAMPEEIFFEMIDRMAIIQLKYELLSETPLGDR